jgi:putative transcriptional regulator
MKQKDIVFNADEFLQVVEETAAHVSGRRTLKMKTTKLSLPPRIETMTPCEIQNIRKRLKVSQDVFARLLNVPTVTEVSWEVGRRNPSGAALRLLQVARRCPDALLSAACG